MPASAAFAWRLILIGSLAPAGMALAEEEPLRSLIDRQLAPVSGVEPVPCSDADFLRRVSLDLAGMPPTADEARAFITDPAEDKRQRLVDRLLASPHYVRHLATMLDLMLMERRPHTHVGVDEWRAWLMKSVRENKPWNVLAREILLADGDDPARRPAVRFALDRASEPNVLTRDIGRIFFGRDMQCAQCHDHPLVEDYLQSDYHGLMAFIAPSQAVVRTEGDKQATLQAERAGTDLTFESVFVGVPRRTGARVPDDVVIDEPFYLPGEEYEVAPAENVKSVPKFSRRATLAELATGGENQAFNRNIVNRLWAHMFGRGLVHPLDLHHPENAAADPELLQMLAERFAAMKFDIRAFVREIALTSAYQRSFDLPAEWVASSGPAAPALAQLQAEQEALAASSAASSEAYTKASDAWQEAEAALLPVATELDVAKTQYAEAKKKLDEALKAAADAAAQLQAKQKVADPVQQAKLALEQAAQALPDEKALAAAAEKLAARSEQLATESAALAKAVAETSAAIEPPTTALQSVKPTVEAALAKLTPLAAALKQTEQAMLAARRQAAADVEALTAAERRLGTVRRMAQLPPLHQAIVAAKRAKAAREAELATANQQLSEFASILIEHETNAKTATEAQTAAANALNSSRSAHATRLEVAQVIVTAFEASEAARQKLPDDAVLTDVAAKLQQRAAAARAESEQLQRQFEAAAAAQKSTDETFVAAQEILAAALAERARREQAVVAATGALAAAQAVAAAKQSELDMALSDLTDRWTSDFTVAALKPLTPEQLCWTVFRVTGVYDRHWQAEVAELDKTSPLSDEQKQDPAQVAARDIELEQKTFDKLKDNLATFVAFYGAGAGQPQGDFFATADQALFAANGGPVNSWVAPASDNVTQRIIEQEDPRQAAEELYLAVLTRLPTDEEAAEVSAYLTGRASEKSAAAQELVWGLLNSAEFRFNH